MKNIFIPIICAFIFGFKVVPAATIVAAMSVGAPNENIFTVVQAGLVFLFVIACGVGFGGVFGIGLDFLLDCLISSYA